MLPFSNRPRREKKKKKIIQKYRMRSFLKSNQTLKTALLMPVTILPSSHERTEGGREGGKEIGKGGGGGRSSCWPHVVRERTATAWSGNSTY